MSDNPLLDAALSYAARGWRVFPCHSIRGGRCSCSNSINVRCAAVPPSPGKHPRTAHGCKDATTDAQQIRDWWTSWPDAHVAIATGAESGLVVLDVDPRHGGDDSLAELETKHGKADTVEALTGSGLSSSQFWTGYAQLLRDLAPRNRTLLHKRDSLQASMDAWLLARRLCRLLYRWY